MARGQCKNVDLSLMYPERGQGGRGSDYASGKAVCHGCPVVNECLDYALAHMYSTGDGIEQAAIGRYGVWGGTTPGERDRMASKVAA